jgi:prophage regulatory protein
MMFCTAPTSAVAPERVQTLINRKQLLAMVPMSERTIFDMEKRGEFPRRFAITSRLVAWDLHDVEAWIKSRKEAAVKVPAPAPPPDRRAIDPPCRPNPAA